MATKILIDAAYPEETRVAVVDGNRRLVALDYDSKTGGQLSGNIYLARVVRVEAALQAAFVDYGGERHGFLAFPEINPSYYQIPQSDRDDAEDAAPARDLDDGDESIALDDADAEVPEVAADADAAPEDEVDAEKAEAKSAKSKSKSKSTAPRYLIQEVIKNRQLMLVQVSKEPRGDKGAALTTYISLAGRYCVLMPNAGRRAGGVSRKISSVEDRKRLKAVTKELEVPDNVGVIMRTAGSGRSKEDIKRDYVSLLELWESIRQRTVDSMAPSLIHDESNIVLRAVRDLFTKDVKEILVEGEAAFESARQYMHDFVSPQQAKNVRQHRGKQRLFGAFGVEEQLDKLFSSRVELRSGGSIVIAQTEALTAIDVNSGRANRERQIENTATRTNLEAAEEIARQLRLRDIAGLVVIDFIDMDEERNRRAVEARFREYVRSDRARISVGGISSFGLLEMSRQRLRKGMLELSVAPCEACGGTGHTRSASSSALSALRQLSEWLSSGKKRTHVELQTSVVAANHLFNEMRSHVDEVSNRFNVDVKVLANPALTGGDVQVQTLEVSGRPEGKSDSASARQRSSRGDSPRRERSRTRSRTRSADDPVESETDDEVAAGRSRAPRRGRRADPADRESDSDDRRRRRSSSRRTADANDSDRHDDEAVEDADFESGRGSSARRGRSRRRDPERESALDADGYDEQDDGPAHRSTAHRDSPEAVGESDSPRHRGRRSRRASSTAAERDSDSDGPDAVEEPDSDRSRSQYGRRGRSAEADEPRSRSAREVSDRGRRRTESADADDRGNGADDGFGSPRTADRSSEDGELPSADAVASRRSFGGRYRLARNDQDRPVIVESEGIDQAGANGDDATDDRVFSRTGGRSDHGSFPFGSEFDDADSDSRRATRGSRVGVEHTAYDSTVESGDSTEE